MVVHAPDRTPSTDQSSSLNDMAEQPTQTLAELLEELGTQLAWVREYL